MNILVTAIGSMSADAVITQLSYLGHVVFGCDIYPSEWHAVTKKCKEVFLAPYPSDTERYLHFLVDISISNAISHIIPLTDPEIDVLNENRDDFEGRSIKLCIPHRETILIARDKYRIFNLFKDDKKIFVPQTFRSQLDDLRSPVFPYIAKPVNGRSSEGLLIINTDEELRLVLNKEKYIFQNYISGSIFAVDYVRNTISNHDFAIPRQELLRTKNGAGTTVKVVNDVILQDLASYIGNKLDVHGCINMEFIRHDDKYFLIDINPRFSAGIAFSVHSGYNMVHSHINCFSGKDILPPIIIKDRIIAKRYREEILKSFE